MKNVNIWLIDDDEVYVHVTKKVLDHLSENIAVVSFDDGENAITQLKKCIQEDLELPGIILLDINMPVLDGWGFLAEFQKLKANLTSSIKIYMVTSSKDQRDRSKAKEFKELSDYLVKPVFEDQLVTILTDCYGDDW
ncbi:MAG: response regulator [Muricauda sp.]|nr:response regulator [Allomuricauda sp.]MBA4746888.1 response regulator [Allomuricauda sp.]